MHIHGSSNGPPQSTASPDRPADEIVNRAADMDHLHAYSLSPSGALKISLIAPRCAGIRWPPRRHSSCSLRSILPDPRSTSNPHRPPCNSWPSSSLPFRSPPSRSASPPAAPQLRPSRSRMTRCMTRSRTHSTLSHARTASTASRPRVRLPSPSKRHCSLTVPLLPRLHDLWLSAEPVSRRRAGRGRYVLQPITALRTRTRTLTESCVRSRLELPELRHLLASELQRHDDQRARHRPREVGPQHRREGPEQAHAWPRGGARRHPRQGEAGVREQVRSVRVAVGFALFCWTLAICLGLGTDPCTRWTLYVIWTLHM